MVMISVKHTVIVVWRHPHPHMHTHTHTQCTPSLVHVCPGPTTMWQKFVLMLLNLNYVEWNVSTYVTSLSLSLSLVSVFSPSLVFTAPPDTLSSLSKFDCDWQPFDVVKFQSYCMARQLLLSWLRPLPHDSAFKSPI